jgi:hypothetical protein
MVGLHRYAKRLVARDGSRTSLSNRPCSWELFIDYLCARLRGL